MADSYLRHADLADLHRHCGHVLTARRHADAALAAAASSTAVESQRQHDALEPAGKEKVGPLDFAFADAWRQWSKCSFWVDLEHRGEMARMIAM